VILEKLFRYSIIAFYRAGGRGYGGSEYVFRYREPRVRFDTTASRFRIHPGLIEVLGLKKITVQEVGTSRKLTRGKCGVRVQDPFLFEPMT